MPVFDDNGAIDKRASRWLSVQLTPSNAPWAFAKSGETYRVIAAMEAFAILLGIKYLVPAADVEASFGSIVVVPALTDNQTNGRVLNKLMTTRFPLSAVVMELAEEMKGRGLIAEVAWAPRSTNEEADALSRGVTDGFDAALRAEVDLSTASWHIFDAALLWGQAFFDEYGHRKADVRQDRARPRRRGRKRPAEDRLKVRDPW